MAASRSHDWEFDPGIDAINAPYTTAALGYYASLGLPTSERYEVLNMEVNKSWRWTRGDGKTLSEANGFTCTSTDLGRALREYEGRGGDPSGIHDVLADYGGETVPPRLLYKRAEQGAGYGMYDDEGNMISPGVAAADFVRELGVDQIAHRPAFGNPQLNLGSEHTISLNPDNVRSRFAAFDPWRRNTAVAASLGFLAPDLLAEELRNPQP